MSMSAEIKNQKSETGNILIVDDMEGSLILLEALLSEFGYNVKAAVNGKDALEELHTEKDYDLIISDILMPVMDGLMLCKSVKKNEKLKNIPFIFYSASFTDQRGEALALKLGVDVFIQKPFEPEEFLKIVQSLLKGVDNDKIKPQEIVSEDDRDTLKLFNECLAEELQTRILALENEIIERKRAEEKLATYQIQLKRLSSALSLTAERERRHISEDLHDRIGQALTVIKMKLEELKDPQVDTDSYRVLDETGKLLDNAIQEIRTLTFEISPPLLYELGFESAVEWLIEQFGERHNILIEYDGNGDGRMLGDDLSFFLFKSVRELLFNVVKHARADRTKVSVRREENRIRISIQDDGVGFDFSKSQFSVNNLSGFGLFSMRERMEYFGGNFDVESKPGRGTRITLIMPLKPQEESWVKWIKR